MAQDPYASTNGNGGNMNLAERTALISARLKTLYKKSILPVEKRFRYDYFYESPMLSEIEFDCKFMLPIDHTQTAHILYMRSQ